MGSKITKKQESEICLECGECCRRYRIAVLPEEAMKIAKNLKVPKRKFLQEDCELFVKMYPKSTPGILTYPTAFFPKNVHKKLRKELGILPSGFFVVLQVVLKRDEGECTFLCDGNECDIYSARPEPCKLFPFIAVPGYRESYPFCPLFRKEQKDYAKKSRAYFKKVKKYFMDVEKKGFEKHWKSPPKKGTLFLSETKIGKITLEEIRVIQSRGN